MIRRIVLILVAAVVVLFAAGVLSAGTACAHDPRFACSPRGTDRPIRIADPRKSWAFYGDLEPHETDHYRFRLQQPATIPANLLIDERDAANPARPVAVVANARGTTVATLDLRAPVNFYEPFSRVHYLSSPVERLSLPAGSYTVDVSMRGGREPQRYAFAIGEEERFGLTEIPFVLGAIYRIHNRKF